VALALVALVSGACGGGGQDAVPKGPCDLVTKAEVEAALSGPVSDGETGNVPTAVIGETACQFTLTDPQKPFSTVRVGVAGAFAPTVFDKFVAGHPKAVPVAKLGERAVWDERAQTVVVLEPHKVLSVVVFGAAVTDHRARAVRLAARALPRL